MSSIIHDSTWGWLVRYCTKGRLYAQPEDKPDFELPWKRLTAEVDDEKVLEAAAAVESTPPPTEPSRESPDNIPASDSASTTVEKDIERDGPPVERSGSKVLRPQKTPDGVILIDWYTEDDAANPQNWPTRDKLVATIIISLYTFGVYSSSAIITPAHQDIQERFNVSYSEASLGLSMYVIGYGIGPLVRFIPRF